MAYDWLTEPVTDDAPCGPNLEAAGDAAFVEYYYEAEARLPERYFTPGLRNERGEGTDDRLFDPKSVDLKKETASIEALLKRSRDLRLLVLLARFQILAGKVGPFADSLEGIAALLTEWIDDVHPRMDGSVADRRMALEELATGVTVLMPLQYLPLTGQPDVTYRRYLVASGKHDARAGEDDATTDSIVAALGDAGKSGVVKATQQALSRAAQALDTIRRRCMAHERHPFGPSFEDTLRVIAEIQDLIHLARADLTPWSADTQAAEEEIPDVADDGAPAKADDAPSNAPAAQAQGIARIGTQAEALAALQAVETYLAHNEPSSAAMLLVTQARLLIGKPLIEALETLLPEHAGKAVIDFGPATGFSLSMERLRALSSAAPNGVAKVEETPATAPPPIPSRSALASYLRGVETYFRTNEPTSPIPILLVRARSYLDKDFEAIVSELIPALPPE